MNKRQQQKQKTRELILKTAKEEFSKNGFLNTTTSQIAQSAGIAHGTLFLHFNNKNALIVEILDIELDQISASIQKLVTEAADLEQMLILYLNMLQEDEELFSVLARELPFYPDELRRLILFRDSLIRSHFHKVIQAGIKAGKYRSLHVTSAVSFLFGTINYYLSLKNIFITDGSVIEKFKTSIVSTFTTLITCDQGANNE
ncbi:MAG: TetR/AcrR family transcriptional regulator [Candidatus Cloacimonadales bacterium]|nr:TetR/AcrR family transcriptional regulator [Candidatus Cloacimonadales bacterium]